MEYKGYEIKMYAGTWGDPGATRHRAVADVIKPGIDEPVHSVATPQIYVTSHEALATVEKAAKEWIDQNG